MPVRLMVGNCVRFGESSRLYMVKAAPKQNVPGTFFGKYEVPTWVEKIHLKQLQLHITKDGQLSKVMDCSTRHHFIFGRSSAHCDVVLEHNSISKQHAVLVHGSPKGDAQATMIDLGASNGTFVSDETPKTTEDMKAMRRLEPQTPIILAPGMCVRFGESSRLYTLQSEGHESVNEKEKDVGQGKFSALISTTTVIVTKKKVDGVAKDGAAKKRPAPSSTISAAERRRRQQQLLSKSVSRPANVQPLQVQQPKPEAIKIVIPDKKKPRVSSPDSGIFELRKK